MRRWAVAVLAAAMAIGGLAGCGRSRPVTLGRPVTRSFWLAAVEFKGGADVRQEAFPPGSRAPGPGVLLFPPRDGRWETEVYRWDPGTLVVFQGDQVKLNFWGVNGAAHPTTIAGYGQAFTVQRGRPAQVTFRADRAGVFAIACQAHGPTMTAYLVVLPRP